MDTKQVARERATALETLYDSYIHDVTRDSSEIYEKHRELRSYCAWMEDGEYDELLSEICDLCSVYEKTAFLEGVRAGFRLGMELLGK